MVLASLLVVFASAAGTWSSASLDKRITIELEATPAERLLPELGKAAGVVMRTRGVTKEDVFVLSVRDVKLRDLMDRIAKADVAEWQLADDGAYELVRTDAMQRNQERTDFAARTEVFRQYQKDYAKKLPPFSGLTADEAESVLKRIAAMDDSNKPNYGAPTEADFGRQDAYGALSANLPLNRLAQRVMLGLDPRFFASLPEWDAYTFSDHPNAAQFRLPLDLAQAYQAFEREHSVFLGVAGIDQDGNGADKPANNHLGYAVFRKPPQKALAKFTRYGDCITLSLTVSNPNQESGWVPNESLFTSTTGPAVDPRQSAVLSDALSPEGAKWVAQLQRREDTSWSPGGVEPEFKKEFLDPVNHEPLAGLTGAAVLAVAHERNLNTVAVLTDQVGFLCTVLQHWKATTVAQTEATLEGGCGLKATIGGGWIEFSPTYPSEAWAQHVDRLTLKSWFNAADGLTPGLSTSAHFALALPRDIRGSLAYLATYFSNSGWRLVSDIEGAYHGLRFYGTLGASQLTSLAQGKSLRVGDMTQEQRSALWNAVYLGGMGFERLGPPKLDTPERQSGSAPYDPTEILGEGLLPSASVTMQSSEELRVIPYAAGRPLDNAKSAVELAYDMKRAEQPAPPELVRASPTEFQLLWQKHVTLRFIFDPDLGGTLNFVESERDPTGRLMKFSELPPSFRDQVMKVMNNPHVMVSSPSFGSEEKKKP